MVRKLTTNFIYRRCTNWGLALYSLFSVSQPSDGCGPKLRVCTVTIVTGQKWALECNEKGNGGSTARGCIQTHRAKFFHLGRIRATFHHDLLGHVLLIGVLYADE